MPDGICPFADNYVNQSTLVGWAPGCFDRVGFCDHTAGGFYSTLTRASFWNDPNQDGNAADAVTVHFGISQEGKIVQVLNIFDTAFAQGRLSFVSWPRYVAMGRRNPNEYLISTEHEDKLVSNYQWSEQMYQADLRLKRWCVEECKRVLNADVMRFGIDSLTGHYMFDPINRGFCPGSGWPRNRLFTDLVAPNAEDPVIVRLNGPDIFENYLFKDPVRQQYFLAGQLGVPDDAKLVLLEIVVRYGEIWLGDWAGGRLGYAGRASTGTAHLWVEIGESQEQRRIFYDTIIPGTLISKIGMLAYQPRKG